jgi:hypothetical protein
LASNPCQRGFTVAIFKDNKNIEEKKKHIWELLSSYFSLDIILVDNCQNRAFSVGQLYEIRGGGAPLVGCRGEVSHGVEKLKMEVNLTLEAAPLWGLPSHCLVLDLAPPLSAQA